MPVNNSYVAQRLAAIGGSSDTQSELEALRTENARLKEQLGQTPSVTLKSESQKEFEQSPEFEQILNIYYIRWLRNKFAAEFNTSPYMKAFQEAANTAFMEFEKRGGARNGQTSRKNPKGTSTTEAGETA